MIMYNTTVRKQITRLFSPVMGTLDNVKDSRLLQAYTTLCEMSKTGIAHPLKAYAQVKAQYASYRHALLGKLQYPSDDTFANINRVISGISYREFLTYVVPGIACDPQRVIDLFNKHYPQISHAELTHHIIQIRYLTYYMNQISSGENVSSDGYDDILDKLYAQYLALEKEIQLPKNLFLQFYSAINTFQLSPQSLSPYVLGFSTKDIAELMRILTDELQMTRTQQFELIERYFLQKEQAAQILYNEKLYNFVSCKDEKTRKKLVNKALKLIAKIPPLELICAISVRKKAGIVNFQNKTDGLILPNDVMLETGFVYPLFQHNIGTDRSTSVLLLYPSEHFIRKVLNDDTMRDRNITFVLRDKSAVSLIQYQIDEPGYALYIGPNVRALEAKTLLDQMSTSQQHYDKIFLFGNHLPTDQQVNHLRSLLDVISYPADLFALLSTYTLENSAKSFLDPYNVFSAQIQSIALIPQGINNSTFPRRKVWVHCKIHPAVPNDYITKIYAYTLDTSLKTQAIAPVIDDPLEVPQKDVTQMDISIRRLYLNELMHRRSSGRSRTMAFSHEITPDIPVWCSHTFPNGRDANPRLEAYVCLPPSEDKLMRGFAARGPVIQSTKKHTTHVPQSEVLDWLENTYPFSTVQQRYTPAERKEQGTSHPLKPAVQIRDEIIQQYTPILSGQNIALKTLWYLYPDLEDSYTGSDYLVLCEMVKTSIGQQRVGDITAELCESMLVDTYPSLTEAALWRNYTILSTALNKAVVLGYCSSNPLETVMQDEKLHRKLFAQVRKQLVKKHLTYAELKLAYQSIITKLQSGDHSYLGVLIRLLTGLESNIVCALRWCDLWYSSDLNVRSFIITRQLSNDGRNVLGFADTEDYICYPLPEGLSSLIKQYRDRLADDADNALILSSVMQLGPAQNVREITPSHLNTLTKSIFKELNIEERSVNLASGDNTFQKINLNKYIGDFIRENFRYWGTTTAKLNPDELAYLLRNKAPSTLGRFYCDFQNDASQLIMAEKLSRLECLLMQNAPPAALRRITGQTKTYSATVLPQNGYRQKVSLEIIGTSSVEVCTHSPLGIRSTAFTFYEEKGTKP